MVLQTGVPAAWQAAESPLLPARSRAGGAAGSLFRMAQPTILWFRRDLRLGDHPALLAALEQAGDAGVIPLFVVDPHLTKPAGANRLAWVWASLRALDSQLGGRLVVLHGNPATVVPRAVRESGAGAVHVSADFGRYGRARDADVASAVTLVSTGSPYGVTPGGLTKGDGTGYRVFTPYSKVWFARGLHSPAQSPSASSFVDGGLTSLGIPESPSISVELPEAGERAGLARLDEFVGHASRGYDAQRNLPAKEGTSRLSPYLKVGALHPRTVIAALKGHTGEGAQTFRTEIVWRDFYADVLWQAPSSITETLIPSMRAMRHDTSQERFEAWKKGETGYPLVDAGMRQLLAQGWMHNRLRMVVASFLVKDLHLPWWWGAQHFLDHLLDGDPASNSGGWQWAAGTGTDAAPYFRVFNPTAQSEKFDPSGEYIRRWVPELASLAGKEIHAPTGVQGYPAPMVEHAVERQESLDRYAETRG